MNILAVIVAAIVGLVSTIYVKVVPQFRQASAPEIMGNSSVSPEVVGISTPSATVKPTTKASITLQASKATEGVGLASWQFPGSKVVSSDLTHLNLATDQEIDVVSKWYQKKVGEISGGKVTTSVSSVVKVESSTKNSTSVSTNISASADTGGNSVSGGTVKTGSTKLEYDISNSVGGESSGNQNEVKISWSDGEKAVAIEITKSAGDQVFIRISSTN